MSEWKDHFSGHAADYAAYRPGYPPALFHLLAGLPRRRALAWDCGTGNGQAATGLAAHFERVIATDASREQIANAAPDPRIEYRIARAESSGLAAGSVDVVCCAQSVHWFDFDLFYREVNRVLAPGGVLALLTYNLARVDEAVDRLTDRLAYQIAAAYWPPERRWVDEEYLTLPFPFREIAVPAQENVAQWDLRRFLLYLGTWSANRRYSQATGSDPVKAIADELAAAWGDPAAVRRVRWPLYMRVGTSASGGDQRGDGSGRKV
ncbi:MAG TPA: class I SAM-dependent methyltransferase [Thermoanaerobaculia bacterium]|nr:class I SAM-dependent methyltransferase [Thermoanaerobaculia bacterium]